MISYTLRDLVTIKNGKDHKHLADGIFPVYGSGGIMRYAESYLYDKPSILLPRKGTLDNIQFCNVPFWTVDTSYYTEVNETLCNPYYLYCYLNLLDLSKLNTGTGVPSMTFDSYYNIKVHLPSQSTQDKIAAFIQSLDRKISLNRSINAELERMAKEIYDYWFVQFEFPDEHGRPYKSSGGAMEYNPVLKREVPKGWEVKQYQDILDKYKSTKKLDTKEYLYEGDIPIIDQGPNYIVGYTNDAEAKLDRLPATLFGDHSLSVKYINFPFARGADGTQILYSNNSNIKSHYLYLSVKSLSIPNPGYSRHFKYLKEMYILQPDSKTSDYFENIVSPIFDMWTKNCLQNVELTNQRDELLPLLMTGQVTIE